MHSNKFSQTLFFLLFLLITKSGFSYIEKPALVMLNIKEQHDTVGFNLVKELPEIFYRKLKTGAISLYDSPKKEVKISFGSLQAIEKKSTVSFTSVPTVFLHEIWSHKGKKTKFYILGFSLSVLDPKGKNISFGYIDAEEAYSFLNSEFIPVNANGSVHTTYWQALMSRKYEFNLVQLGKTLDLKKLLKEKRRAFNPKIIIEGKTIIPEIKLVRYSIDSKLTNDNGRELLAFMEKFLKENPEEYFNFGGQKISGSEKKTDFKVERAEITETWSKQESYIGMDPVSFRLQLNDGELDSIPLAELERFALKIKFRSVKEFLKDKQFTYTIETINGQVFMQKESDRVLQALKTYPWSQVTQYLKYY